MWVLGQLTEGQPGRLIEGLCAKLEVVYTAREPPSTPAILLGKPVHQGSKYPKMMVQGLEKTSVSGALGKQYLHVKTFGSSRVGSSTWRTHERSLLTLEAAAVLDHQLRLKEGASRLPELPKYLCYEAHFLPE